MPTLAPTTVLATHEVTIQPGEWAGRNLFTADPVFRAAVLREGGDWLDAPLTALGADVGSEHVLELGALANRHPPELQAFDRWGRRLDEVCFHPAYHELMALAMHHGIHDIAWRRNAPGGHVAHASMLALFTEAEAGVMCPVNMTYASVPALRAGGAADWAGRVVGGQYDASLRPASEKRGVTLGMAMTEKQGGSDVRANTSYARPSQAGRADGAWRLTGHKWFCSAPMSDAFLTLAHTDRGLSCFLVPHVTPDGARNAVQLQRLKDKLGNRSNASAEIEYHGAHATLLGEEGRGVPAIIGMVHHTRLGTVAATVGIMAMALAQAAHHTAGRRAFGRVLADHAAMTGVLADLALEYEAAVLLLARVARAFDDEPALARLAVAAAKYWLTSRCPAFVFAAMECHGGAGYVEEGPMPRLFRESPLNAIWEGSGNVIALDILRTLAREPAAHEALFREVRLARGAHRALDEAAEALRAELATLPGEAEARYLAERMALLLQGALLARHAPGFVSDAFVRSRLGGEGGRSPGALPRGADAGAILARYRGSAS